MVDVAPAFEDQADELQPHAVGSGRLPPLDRNVVSAADCDPDRFYLFLRMALAQPAAPNASAALLKLRQTWAAMVESADRPEIANGYWEDHIGLLEFGMGRTGSPARLTEKP